MAITIRYLLTTVFEQKKSYKNSIMMNSTDIIPYTIPSLRSSNLMVIGNKHLGPSIVQGPLLLTWINLNPWISNHVPNKVWDEITYPSPNCTDSTVEVCEWIIYLIPCLIIDAITYQYCDQSQTMIVKELILCISIQGRWPILKAISIV